MDTVSRWRGSSGLEGVPEAITAQVAEYIQSAARGIVDQARTLAPIAAVNGGELKASIDGELSESGLSATIGSSGLDYARHVEFGTSDTPAQPFLFPAFQANVRVLRKNLREVLKGSTFRLRSRVSRAKATRK